MLSGITIVEFEALGPAPFAGGFFAELGAEVIVIHRADDTRSPQRHQIAIGSRQEIHRTGFEKF